MRAPEAGAKNFRIFWRRAVFLCIWKERLLKMWTFLLGWGGGAGAPSAPPLATGLTALHAFHWLRAGEGLCDRDVYLVFS